MEAPRTTMFEDQLHGADADDGKLRSAVLNEMIAPEVLSFQQDLITKTKKLLSDEEEKTNHPYRGETEDAFLKRRLLTSWYLQRVKYLLSAYLQTRLRKIQRHAEYILHSEKESSKLSANELHFLRQYRELELEQSKAVDIIPAKLAERLGESAVPKAGMPKLSTNVFIKVVEDVGTQDLDGIGIELPKGAIYYLPYRDVRNLIKEEADKVALM